MATLNSSSPIQHSFNSYKEGVWRSKPEIALLRFYSIWISLRSLRKSIYNHYDSNIFNVWSIWLWNFSFRCSKTTRNANIYKCIFGQCSSLWYCVSFDNDVRCRSYLRLFPWAKWIKRRMCGCVWTNSRSSLCIYLFDCSDESGTLSGNLSPATTSVPGDRKSYSQSDYFRKGE